MQAPQDFSLPRPMLRPVLLGELLWDVLPTGEAIPGGAPFIVAWHLRGFGADPLLLSAVGHDSYGDDMVAVVQDWGLDTRGIQRVAAAPTGTVQVQLQDGQPTFVIPPDQAYDHVDGTLARKAIPATAALLYHGTLACRTPQSRQMLADLHRHTGLPILVDINLRDPYWDAPFVREAVQRARWVKLNQAEFQILTQQEATPAAVQQLCQDWDLEAALVTLGSRGAMIGTPEQVWMGDPVPVRHLADTVGAGDAFTSVWILGHSLGWDWPTILARGLAFSSRLCEIPGGTTRDPDLYAEFRHAWGIAAQT
ncbi:MAG: carbohydrate kinase [Synechococcales cyanobacterium]